MGKIITFIQTIVQKLKNLDQLLADLFKWLTSLGLDAKAAVVLERGVSFNMDVLFGLFTTIKKATKKRWIKQLKKIGFSYKTEGEIITFVHKEQEIFKGTLQEAETELASYFKNAKNSKKERKSLEKYLDDLPNLNIYSKKYIGRKLQDLVSQSKAFKLFGKVGKQTVKAVDYEAKKLINSSLSKKLLGKKVMVSGMTYKNGNKISKTFVNSNFIKRGKLDEIGELVNRKWLDELGNPSKYQKFLDDMHPTLKKRFEKHLDEIKKGLNAEEDDIIRAGIEGSHGEIRALDALLKDVDPLGKLGDDVFKDIIGYNRYLIKDGIQPPCTHCYFLTNFVKYIGL